MAADKKDKTGGASGTTDRVKPILNNSLETQRNFQDIGTLAQQVAFLKSAETRQDLNEDQLKAIESYVSVMYNQGMNAYLRKGAEGFNEWIHEWHIYKTEGEYKNTYSLYEELVNTLVSAPAIQLGRDVVLYRHMSFSSGIQNELRDFIYDAESNGTLIGSNFIDKGFGSTSTDSGILNDWNVQLIIRAPKETKVWIPSTNGEYASEREVILKPNARYTIRSFNRDDSNNLILNVDLD